MPATEIGVSGRPITSMNSVLGPPCEGSSPSSTATSKEIESPSMVALDIVTTTLPISPCSRIDSVALGGSSRKLSSPDRPHS
jgi:hypothetical protein